MMRTLTPFLSLVIAVLLYVFFTYPEYTKVSQLQAEINQYEEAHDRYSQFEAELERKLAIKNNRPMADNEKLDTLIPAKVDDAELLVILDALTSKHNLLFGNIKTESGEAVLGDDEMEEGGQSDELASTDISFEVIGTYEQFKSFLMDMEQSLNLFEVTNIDLTAGGGQFQQYSVQVRSYALPRN